MATDVHLGGRGGAGGKLGGRKTSYDMSGGYEYYGEDGQEWWDEESAPLAGYDAMAAGNHWGTYYDEFSAGHGEYESNFEIDLHSMVFVLTENLEPQDFYLGMAIDEKSFLFDLRDDDIDEHMPPAWKSRPLKIHPEPAPRTERKEPPSLVGILDSASSTAVVSPGSAHSPASGQNLRDDSRLSQRSENDSNSAQDEAGSPKSSGTDKAVSPKIVISNSQLLNLKEKMQALKQRRSIAPMELPPPAHEKAGADDEKNGKEANSRSEKGKAPITSNCPGAHGLKMFNTPDSGWWCSVCENEHPQGTPFFGCRVCDYDECEVCARAPVASKKKRKQEKIADRKVRSRSSSHQGRSTSAPSPPRSKAPRPSKESAASEKKVQQEANDDSPSDDTPLRRDNRREKRRDEEETVVEKKRKSTTKEVRVEKRAISTKEAAESREARAEFAKRASSTKDADRADVREAKLSKASLRESTASSSSAAKPRTPGAALASAARAAAASAAGRNAQAASPASDDEESSEEAYRAPREARRGPLRDSRLVPRDKRPQPEHWDPRDRPEPREAVGLKRRAPPERSAPQHASRSRSDSEEEPPPKKRAGGSSLVSNEDLAHGRGSASSSASGLRAPVRSPVASEEAPRAARARPTPRRESGNDLLRRVLGANRMASEGGTAAKRPAPARQKEMSPEPPPRENPNSKGSGSAAILKSSARDGPAGRFLAAGGIRKALEGVKNQHFQVEARKSRGA